MGIYYTRNNESIISSIWPQFLFYNMEMVVMGPFHVSEQWPPFISLETERQEPGGTVMGNGGDEPDRI